MNTLKAALGRITAAAAAIVHQQRATWRKADSAKKNPGTEPGSLWSNWTPDALSVRWQHINSAPE